MRVAKDSIEVKMQIPGAVIRQRTDLGDATGLGKISGEYFSLAAGVDTTPLFQGLEDNLCQCPHWGVVVSGELRLRYADAMFVKEDGASLAGMSFGAWRLQHVNIVPCRWSSETRV